MVRGIAFRSVAWMSSIVGLRGKQEPLTMYEYSERGRARGNCLSSNEWYVGTAQSGGKCSLHPGGGEATFTR